MSLTEPKLSNLLNGWLARKNYWQIDVFLGPMVVEQKDAL